MSASRIQRPEVAAQSAAAGPFGLARGMNKQDVTTLVGRDAIYPHHWPIAIRAVLEGRLSQASLLSKTRGSSVLAH